MKRKEEIEKEATNYINSDAVSPMNMQLAFGDFINGAQWADKTMIERGCEYLRMSMYNTPIFEHEEDENPVNYVCASCCDSVEEFIENFRKAMEE